MDLTMEEIAKKLDIEMGKDFEIKGLNGCPLKLTKNGLIDSDYENHNHFLAGLLSGEIKIVKLSVTCEEAMTQVASIFGLELYQRFIIKDVEYNPYQFTGSGIIDCYGDSARTEERLFGLLTCQEKIVKGFLTKDEKEVLRWCAEREKQKMIAIKKTVGSRLDVVFANGSKLYWQPGGKEKFDGLKYELEYTVEELEVYD